MRQNLIAHTLPVRAYRAGFSLVELSIVLVILGLLVGGVLGGRTLIQAAELRAIVAEARQYQTVAHTFRTRYNRMPGDFDQATRFWGQAHGTPSSCFSMDKRGNVGTCNGNGDGVIAANVDREEHFLFWHHLQKAGLVSGDFTGASDPACGSGSCTQAHTPGLNCPVSKKGGDTCWAAYYKGASDGSEGNPNWFLGQYGHIIALGSRHVGGDALPNRPALSAIDAWNVDIKLDDGRPARGNVVVRAGNYPGLAGCTEVTLGSGTTTGNSHLDSVYRTSRGDQIDCNLILRHIF